MCHKNIIEISGNNPVDCQQAYLMISNNSLVKIRDTKVQLELGLEHKDFINGKKNGKINRITKLSGCRLTFQETQDINMMIDLYSPNPSQLLQGLEMLEEELPSEISFFVPETYHKRIIGVAGKNIQKIMKKFGVYVKFSNYLEYSQLCGYYENRDNVICRTPSKNKQSLGLLRGEILEVVGLRELVQEEGILEVDRQILNYLFQDGKLFDELEREFGITVCFKESEQGKDQLGLFGPEHLLEDAKNVVKRYIPVIRVLKATNAKDIAFREKKVFLDYKKKLLDNDVQFRVFNQLQAVVFYWIFRPQLDTKTMDTIIKELKVILETLELTIGDKLNVNISPKQPVQPQQFDENTFSHFNSKLLEVGSDMQRQQSFGFFSEQSAAPNSNNSHANLRQLFDSGSQTPPQNRKSTVSLISRQSNGSSASNMPKTSITSINSPGLVIFIDYRGSSESI